jgi:hypothetical protein
MPMTNPDENAVLFAIETLAHTAKQSDDYRLNTISRQCQRYIEACGPMWKAWKAMMEEGQ